MKCPNDDSVLAMNTREGIEIDYCPKCRGIWLDRGELDKIIERSDEAYRARGPVTSAPVPGQEYFKPGESEARFEGPNYRDDDRSYRGTYDSKSDGFYGDPHKRKHHKDSFLGDLFDF